MDRFTQTRDATLAELAKELELMKAGQFEQAESMLRQTHDRMAAVEADLSRLQRLWQSQALQRHVGRSASGLAVKADPPLATTQPARVRRS